MKTSKRKLKHKHTWGRWEPAPYCCPSRGEVRRCTGCDLREERSI